MLHQIVWAIKHTQQKPADLDLLQRVEACSGRFGPYHLVYHLAVGAEAVRVGLHGSYTVPADPNLQVITRLLTIRVEGRD